MSARKKKQSPLFKVLAIVLIVAALSLLSSILSKVYNLYQLSNQAKEVERQLELLKDENADLASTKEKLEDPDYVQTYARGEYMFSKGDEKVFYLPGGKSE